MKIEDLKKGQTIYALSNVEKAEYLSDLSVDDYIFEHVNIHASGNLNLCRREIVASKRIKGQIHFYVFHVDKDMVYLNRASVLQDLLEWVDNL